MSEEGSATRPPDEGSNAALAAALFEAFTADDADRVRAICHADLRAQQNGRPAMDLEALVGFNSAVSRVVVNFRYEV